MTNDMIDIDHSLFLSSSVPNDLPLDHNIYADDIANAEIPEEKAREVLDAIWSIMRLFVECGFSIDVSGKATMEIFNQTARGAEKDKA